MSVSTHTHQRRSRMAASLRSAATSSIVKTPGGLGVISPSLLSPTILSRGCSPCNSTPTTPRGNRRSKNLRDSATIEQVVAAAIGYAIQQEKAAQKKQQQHDDLPAKKQQKSDDAWKQGSWYKRLARKLGKKDRPVSTM